MYAIAFQPFTSLYIFFFVFVFIGRKFRLRFLFMAEGYVENSLQAPLSGQTDDVWWFHGFPKWSQIFFRNKHASFSEKKIYEVHTNSLETPPTALHDIACRHSCTVAILPIHNWQSTLLARGAARVRCHCTHFFYDVSQLLTDCSRAKTRIHRYLPSSLSSALTLTRVRNRRFIYPVLQVQVGVSAPSSPVQQIGPSHVR